MSVKHKGVFSFRAVPLSHPSFSMITGSSRIKELADFLSGALSIPGALRGATQGYNSQPVIGVVPRKNRAELVIEWFPKKINCYAIDLPGRGRGAVPLLGDENWLIAFKCTNDRGVHSPENFSSLEIELKLGKPVPNYKPVERFSVTRVDGILKIDSVVVTAVHLENEARESTETEDLDLSKIEFPTETPQVAEEGLGSA